MSIIQKIHLENRILILIFYKINIRIYKINKLTPDFELFLLLNRHEHLKSRLGQAVSHRLQPTQSSTRGDEAIWPDLHPSHGTISNTSVGHARTHCVQPMQVS